MLSWLLKLFPQDYKWSVGIKKVAYFIGKLAAAGLAYTKAQQLQTTLGIHIDPEAFQTGVATFTGGALEAIHDWLRVKFPNVKWL